MSATRKRIRELEHALGQAAWELELIGDARARDRASLFRAILRGEEIELRRPLAELAYEVEKVVTPTEALCLRCLPDEENYLRQVDGVTYCPVHGLDHDA